MAEFTQEEKDFLSELICLPGYPEYQAKSAAGILNKIGIHAVAVTNPIINADNWIVRVQN